MRGRRLGNSANKLTVFWMCACILRYREGARGLLMLIRILLFLFIFSSLGFAAPIDFVEGDLEFYSCAYQIDQPIVLFVDTAASCKEGKSEDNGAGICTGTIKCATQNKITKQRSWNIEAVACDVNADGSCPLAAECFLNNSTVLKSANTKPVIKSRQHSAQTPRARGESQARVQHSR